MKVTDQQKWQRAKIIFTTILAITIIGCIGGLEGTEPMPQPEIAMMLFPVLVYMCWNVTKQNP